jgi:hypothetical protein
MAPLLESVQLGFSALSNVGKDRHTAFGRLALKVVTVSLLTVLGSSWMRVFQPYHETRTRVVKDLVVMPISLGST